MPSISKLLRLTFVLFLFYKHSFTEDKSNSHNLPKKLHYDFTATVETFRYFDGTNKQQFASLPSEVSAKVSIGNPQKGTTTAEITGKIEIQDIVKELNQFRIKNVDNIANEPHTNKLADLGLSEKIGKGDKFLKPVKDKTPSYVMFHLVHSGFGGKADYDNLVAMTNSANQVYYREVESKLKQFTANEADILKQIKNLEIKNPNEVELKIKKLEEQLNSVKQKDYINKYPESGYELHVTPNYVKSELPKQKDGKIYYDASPVPDSLTIKIKPFGSREFKKVFYEEFQSFKFLDDGYLVGYLKNDGNSKLLQEKPEIPKFTDDSNHLKSAYDKIATNYLESKNAGIERNHASKTENTQDVSNKKNVLEAGEMPLKVGNSEDLNSHCFKSGPSCVFIIEGSNDENVKKNKKNINDVMEVRSKEFIAEYKTGDDSKKRILAEIAEKNKVKITGDVDSVKTVSKLIELENMKKHKAKIEYGTQVLKTGKLFGPKSKAGGYDEMDLLQGTKLSRSKLAKVLSKHEKGMQKASKVTGRISKFFLAKAIASGVINGDVTSLAIIGGRIAGDIFLSSTHRMSAAFSKKFAADLATKTGKKIGLKVATNTILKGLAKSAAFIGLGVDLGFSAYNLATAVQTYTNPNATIWEQNNAIADMVGATIDIVASVVVFAIIVKTAIVAPPIALLAAVVGIIFYLFTSAAVATYKATNHVNMLDSKIKLLGFEKFREGSRNFAGQKTTEYIILLIAVRDGNNIVSKEAIKFLKENPEYLKKISPSLSVENYEECVIKEKWCSFQFWGWCTEWKTNTLSWFKGDESSCYYEKNRQSGTSHSTWLGKEYSYENTYKCDCQTKQKYFSHKNSKVDFRSEMYVYPERSRPNHIEYGFETFCYPSSTSYKGYQISESDRKYSYLCENAIGVRSIKRTGNLTLFDLGDGEDEIYLSQNDESDNVIIVDDGYKHYYGGAGRDVFVVRQCNELRGILHGNGGEDVLQLGGNCAPSYSLTVDGSAMWSPALSTSEFKIRLKSIEIIQGRVDKSESIYPSCETKSISGRGGFSASDPDTIILSDDLCPSYSMSIHAQGFTFVAHSVSKGMVQVYIAEQYRKTFVSRTTIPRKNAATITYFLNIPIHNLQSVHCEVSPNIGYKSIFIFHNGQKVGLDFNDDQLFTSTTVASERDYLNYQPGIIFPQENGDSYILIQNGTGICEAWHLLRSSISIGKQQRKGALQMSNVFRLFSGCWEVTGGQKSDTFILTGDYFCGNINGKGGINSFLIHGSVSIEKVLIGYFENVFCSYNDLRISLFNVHHFSGRVGKTEDFTSSCDTLSISGNGGKNYYSPDLIRIPETQGGRGCDYNLKVVASKYTKVVSTAIRGTIIYNVTKESHCDFEFIVKETINIVFQLEFPLSQLVTYTSSVSTNQNNVTSYTIFLHLENGIVGFKFQNFITNQDTGYLSSPDINVVGARSDGDIEAIVLVEEVSGSISVMHTLTNKDLNNQLTTKIGSKNIPNIFQCTSGAWMVQGGNFNDHFVLHSYEFSGSLSGGGGSNSLILQDSLYYEIMIYLEQGHIKSGWSPNWIVSVENIHNIIGRSTKREIIYPACSTKFINGKGGSDLIVIDDNNNCNYNLTVIATDTTTVESDATKGAIVFDVLANNGPSNFVSTFIVTPKVKLLFQINFAVSELFLSEASVAGFDELWYSIKLNFSPNHKTHFRFKNEQMDNKDVGKYLSQPDIVFVDSKGETEAKLLVDSISGSISILHTLNVSNSFSGVRTRVGARVVSNLFQLFSGHWVVTGGNFDDYFILDSTKFSGVLNGETGMNSLILNNGIPDGTIINLEKGYITNDKISSWAVKLEKVQVIKGRSNKSDTIYCSCNTKDVDGQGGSDILARDFIIIPEMTSCLYDRMTIHVMKHTHVQNRATSGEFRYIVHYLEDIQHIEFIPGSSRHVFQFQFGFDNFKSVSFNQTSKNLTFETFADVSISFHMEAGKTENSDYNDPKLLFVEFDKMGNPIQFEVRVRGNGDVYTHISLKDTFIDNVIGLRGAENNFVVGGEGVDLGVLIGGEGNDNFWVNSARSIREINGGKGKLNHLKLFDSFYPGEMIVVDLYSDEGGIVFLNGSEQYLVESLKNLQIFTGRDNSSERVIVGCDTRKLQGVEQVIFIDETCPPYDIAININKNTSVQFESVLFITDDDFEVTTLSNYGNGSFFYLFEELTSFSLLVAEWEILGNSKHVFYLKFKITDLDKIGFSDFKLTYSISNETFYHNVNYNTEEYQQFYSQPNFITLDGFHIQVTMYGEIFMTYGNVDEAVDLSFISTNLVPLYGSLANKLQANIIFRTKSDFIYIGYKNEHGGLETTNLLTNTNHRSHLIGGGGNNAVYSILDPNFDTYIYPGFHDTELIDKNGMVIKQVLDLTHTASIIRNFTQSKYIPSIVESSNDLIIAWDKWEHIFPGKIILIEGKKYSAHFQLLLNVVAMELSNFGAKTTDDKGKSIHKRDVNSQNKWEIVPTPMSIEQGSTVLISADDLEDNQEIRYQTSGSENQTNSHVSFRMASEEGNLIVSNLASTNDISEVVTFVILDYGDLNSTKENDSTLHQMTNVMLNMGELKMDVKEIEIEQIENWEVVIEDSEEVLLKDLPEIPRMYTIPFWKKYNMNLVIICSAAFLTFMVLALVASICVTNFINKRPYDTSSTRSEIYESVACTDISRKVSEEEITDGTETDSILSEEYAIMNDDWKLS